MINASDNKRFTVLYVEDETIVRNNVETCLKYMFNVVIAKNGQEGLDKFTAQNIDLIITDINMPKKDGISMIRDIKKINPSVPCIVTSAIDKEVIEKIKSLGICKCISKPFDVKVLLDNSVEVLKVS